MNPFFSQEDIKTFISNIIFGLVGFFSSILIEAYKKRKVPKNQEEIVSQINLAASDNIRTAQDLLDVVEDIRKKERIYFLEQIDRSQKESEEKIDKVTMEYNTALDLVRKKAEDEKLELMRKIDQLEKDKENLQIEVKKLKLILSKYEGSEHK